MFPARFSRPVIHYSRQPIKNGELITLDPNAYGTKCIAASGNDVYIASQTGLSTEVIIFKNGVMQKLGPHTKAYDMFLLEFNEYVPGFEGSGADTAIYWKK